MTQRPPHAPVPAEHEDDDEGMSAEVRRTLAELSPWAISVAVHLLLVVAAVFLVWSTVLVQEEEPWGGEVALNNDKLIQPMQDVNHEQAEESASQRTAPILRDQPDPEPIMRTPGTGQPLVQVPRFPDGPQRFRDGPDDGDGPTSNILGPTGRKTVFVIDASGSLIDTFPLVINELKRLLHRTAQAERERTSGPAFAYAVVFFRGGEVLVQDRRGLRTADAEHVGRSVDWLDGVQPGGATSPLPAIELALSYQPDTIIVLSDNITGHGQYEIDADDLVGRVLQVRGDRRITINTVQFLYPDPLVAYGQMGTLERLAKETDGSYRFVTDRELNLR